MSASIQVAHYEQIMSLHSAGQLQDLQEWVVGTVQDMLGGQ